MINSFEIIDQGMGWMITFFIHCEKKNFLNEILICKINFIMFSQIVIDYFHILKRTDSDHFFQPDKKTEGIFFSQVSRCSSHHPQHPFDINARELSISVKITINYQWILWNVILSPIDIQFVNFISTFWVTSNSS